MQEKEQHLYSFAPNKGSLTDWIVDTTQETRGSRIATKIALAPLIAGRMTDGHPISHKNEGRPRTYAKLRMQGRGRVTAHS